MALKEQIDFDCPECGEAVTIELSEEMDGGAMYEGGCCGKAITLYFQDAG